MARKLGYTNKFSPSNYAIGSKELRTATASISSYDALALQADLDAGVRVVLENTSSFIDGTAKIQVSPSMTISNSGILVGNATNGVYTTDTGIVYYKGGTVALSLNTVSDPILEMTNGTNKLKLTATGLALTNLSTGKGFALDASGNATFSGNLSAATGSFVGAVSAGGGKIGDFLIGYDVTYGEYIASNSYTTTPSSSFPATGMALVPDYGIFTTSFATYSNTGNTYVKTLYVSNDCWVSGTVKNGSGVAYSLSTHTHAGQAWSGYNSGGSTFSVTNTADVNNSVGFTGIASGTTTNVTGVAGVTNSSSLSSVGVYGIATSSGDAIYGYSANGDGVVGNSGNAAFYDFKAVGVGINGPFTGGHDILLDKTEVVEVGDILVDTGTVYKKSISKTSCVNTKSSTANQPSVGVFVARSTIVNELGLHDETVIDAMTFDEIEVIKSTHDTGVMNSLGEGQINVIGEGGDIAIGDLIVSSSTPGKGMRQSDGIIYNYTVAKAREAVTFGTMSEEKQIACIYLCG